MSDHERSDEVPAVSAERLVSGELPETGSASRRYPSTIGGTFYLLVLVGTFVGLAVVAFGSWRTGVRWIGGSMVFAALVRLLLRNEDAGMLAVRPKVLDITILAGTGVALIVLASSIPDQPG